MTPCKPSYAGNTPRYGTPEWHKAVAVERAKIERLITDGAGREAYGRGRFESVL